MTLKEKTLLPPESKTPARNKPDPLTAEGETLTPLPDGPDELRLNETVTSASSADNLGGVLLMNLTQPLRSLLTRPKVQLLIN